jgi:hypothetical protein
MYAKASETRSSTARSAQQAQAVERTNPSAISAINKGDMDLGDLIRRSPIRPKLVIGKPKDRFEEEADKAAEQMTQGKPKVHLQAEEKEKKEEEEEPIQARREDLSAVPRSIEQGLAANKSAGTPLEEETRAEMEGHFHADFSLVRLHTDAGAAAMNQALGARAFTHENHIYFGAGKYDPGGSQGKGLIAHELTHVLQQGAAVRRKSFPVSSAPKAIQRLPGIIRDRLARYARHVPGYTLLTVVIGYDPIAGRGVAGSPENLLGGLMGLVPFGTALYDKLVELGLVERAFSFVRAQIERFDLSMSRLERTVRSAYDEMDFFRLDIFDYNLGVLRRHLGALVSDVRGFASSIANRVLAMIKEALLGALQRVAESMPGYRLLTVVLGRDPFTGQGIARNAVNLIRGFMEFVPGGEEKFRNLQESGAIDRAFAWLEEEVANLDLSMATVVALFRRAWESLSIHDLMNPVGAFQRMVQILGPPVTRIIRFAAAVGMKILEFIFEGIMGAGGARVLGILGRARDTFLIIIQDPVGFVGNLIRAVLQGFRQFAANILRHLQAGLVGWLFGALEGAGLRLPERFDLQGIVSLVLQILGLTYERIRPRLVRLMGEPSFQG